MASFLSQMGFLIAKKAVSILGPVTVAKQAVKNPKMTRKAAEMIIKAVIKK